MTTVYSTFYSLTPWNTFQHTFYNSLHCKTYPSSVKGCTYNSSGTGSKVRVTTSFSSQTNLSNFACFLNDPEKRYDIMLSVKPHSTVSPSTSLSERIVTERENSHFSKHTKKHEVSKFTTSWTKSKMPSICVILSLPVSAKNYYESINLCRGTQSNIHFTATCLAAPNPSVVVVHGSRLPLREITIFC